MMERAASMAFAPGAMVFPGGRVDPGDLALGRDEEGAARVAAIRETIEEMGVAVGLTPPPDAATVAALRRGLAAGGDFAVLLDGEGLAIDLAALVPFARWRPDLYEVRRFDTRFYLAEARPGAEALIDGTEGVAAIWGTAAGILADAAAGRHKLIFPTRCNLERLAGFASFAAAAAHAAGVPPRIVTPRIEERDGEPWLTIPDDAGYPVTAQRMAELLRG